MEFEINNIQYNFLKVKDKLKITAFDFNSGSSYECLYNLEELKKNSIIDNYEALHNLIVDKFMESSVEINTINSKITIEISDSYKHKEDTIVFVLNIADETDISQIKNQLIVLRRIINEQAEQIDELKNLVRYRETPLLIRFPQLLEQLLSCYYEPRGHSFIWGNGLDQREFNIILRETNNRIILVEDTSFKRSLNGQTLCRHYKGYLNYYRVYTWSEILGVIVCKKYELISGKDWNSDVLECVQGNIFIISELVADHLSELI